jgi:hypothetical protein
LSETAAQVAIASVAFAVTFLLVTLTRLHPMAVGCLLPLAAAGAVWILLAIRPAESSTASLAIPFMAVFAAAGSVPAAFLAGFWTGRLK